MSPFRANRDSRSQATEPLIAPEVYHPSTDAVQPGSKLGRYRIVSSVGSGSMGEVYRADDTKLEREVAIKLLPEQLSGDRYHRERLEQGIGSCNNACGRPPRSAGNRPVTWGSSSLTWRRRVPRGLRYRHLAPAALGLGTASAYYHKGANE